MIEIIIEEVIQYMVNTIFPRQGLNHRCYNPCLIRKEFPWLTYIISSPLRPTNQRGRLQKNTNHLLTRMDPDGHSTVYTLFDNNEQFKT